MNSITTASETNPFLVKIMPGVYDIGANLIRMKDFVDIEGSGSRVTKIVGSWDGDGWGLILAQYCNCGIKGITVENTVAGNYAIGIFIYGGASNNVSLTLEDLVVRASGALRSIGIKGQNADNVVMRNVSIVASGTQWSKGILESLHTAPWDLRDIDIVVSGASDQTIGYENLGGNATIRNLTLTASGTGYVTRGAYICYNGTMNCTNCVISASGVNDGSGVVTNGASVVTLLNSAVTGSRFGLKDNNPNPSSTLTVRGSSLAGIDYSFWGLGGLLENRGVATTQLVGPVSATARCFGVYDENYAEVVCQ